MSMIDKAANHFAAMLHISDRYGPTPYTLDDAKTLARTVGVPYIEHDGDGAPVAIGRIEDMTDIEIRDAFDLAAQIAGERWG